MSRLFLVSENSAGGFLLYANLIGLVKRLNSHSFSAMGVSDEAGVVIRLWTKFKKDVAPAQYNPFGVSFAVETLNVESFQEYMVQDAYFLKAFVQA